MARNRRDVSVTGYCFFFLVGFTLVAMIKFVYWPVHMFYMRCVQFLGPLQSKRPNTMGAETDIISVIWDGNHHILNERMDR
jgi:hypothetical protein